MNIDQVTRQWIRSAADEHAAAGGYRFDEARPAHVANFFRRFLRHSKGEWAGKPLELLAWQWSDVIAPLFGWYRPEDGTRRYRKAYIEVPKKQGKSTLASAVGLYMLVADREMGAEVYSAATDVSQASIVHGEAVNMVDASPELSAVLQVNRSTKTIAHQKSKSYYRALSAEAAGKEGLNAHCIIADELHVWHGRRLWDALRYAFAARRQGLFFIITTAGDDVTGVCYEQHTYAERIISGEIMDDRTFAYIRAASPSDDWTNPEVWQKANPSLGHTVKVDDFAADCREAQKTPTAQSSFKRYRLNIWATSSNPWLKPEDWDACKINGNQDELDGLPCYGGLDLAKTQDMSALVLVFPRHNGRFALLPFFWLPEEVVAAPDRPEEYRLWARQGLIETTPGNACDYAFIKRRFVELAQRYRIIDFAFDAYNAEQVTQEIAMETGIERYVFRQTMGCFNEPMKEFERLVLNRGLQHYGHPVLSWHVRNTTARTDANNNMRPVKPEQGNPRKIDGCVASIMGLARAMTHPAERDDHDPPDMFFINL